MTTKRLIKSVLLLFLVVFILIILDAILNLYVIKAKPIAASSEKFITANPLNLSQIIGISKFRSCQGHDNSGKNAEGEIENSRSMKHYIVPRRDISELLHTIEIYAPFDGEVTWLMQESKGSMAILAPYTDKEWGFIIFHIDPVEGVKKGSPVTAGQLIGHANVKGRHDFDIGLTRTQGNLAAESLLKLVRGTAHFPFPKATYLVSPFSYMTDNVISEFKTAGFNTDNLEISKAARDQAPCDFQNSAQYKDDWIYLPGQSPEEIQQRQRDQAHHSPFNP